LITGIKGFVGQYLADYLLKKGDEIYGLDINFKNFNILNSLESVNIMECNVTNANKIDSIIRSVKPERIYHLAAQPYPTVSWDKPRETFEINVTGTINIFESVKKNNLNSRILVACSSAEYGLLSKKEIPVSESHLLLPLHPYGVSKVAQDLLAYQYYKNFGIDTVRARIFNTTGPGKINDVCSDFTYGIVMIEKGLKKPPLKVGNLNTERDITDVRDMIKALYLLLEKGNLGDVYNVCSAKAIKVSHLLNLAIDLSEIESKVDKKLLRPSDEPILIGDNTKIKHDTGWNPVISINETIQDMLKFWRKTI
tara:strand:+ start:101 stop:1030 length:930 start_codon:yes stop_codon:yes gene_type:complete